MISENNKVIIHTLRTTGLLPVFNNSDVDAWAAVMKIAYRCGVRVFEFTHVRDARGLRLFAHLIESAAQYPGLIIGAGTLLDALTADRYLKAGAQFIATPFLREDMADVCLKRGGLWMPGCSTEVEIEQARALGAEVISILPGYISGPDQLSSFVKDPTTQFIPSTSAAVTEDNLYRWIEAGALCIRMGLSLFPKETIAIKDWVKVERNISGTITAIRNVRNVHPTRLTIDS